MFSRVKLEQKERNVTNNIVFVAEGLSLLNDNNYYIDGCPAFVGEIILQNQLIDVIWHNTIAL